METAIVQILRGNGEFRKFLLHILIGTIRQQSDVFLEHRKCSSHSLHQLEVDYKTDLLDYNSFTTCNLM